MHEESFHAYENNIDNYEKKGKLRLKYLKTTLLVLAFISVI